MLFETINQSVTIDVDATKNYYINAKEYNCPCSGCNNFMAAVDMIPEAIAQTLKQFGVDSRKLMRVSALTKQKNGNILYDCTFRVVGSMNFNTDQTSFINFFLFSDDNKRYYPCIDFPEPCVEGEFIISLPWIIEEECNY